MMTEEDRVDGDTEHLLRNAADGDRSAREGLLLRHLPGLRAYLRLHTSPAIRAKESVSDLAQSVCREVLLSLESFDYRGEAAFRHWLFTMALRKLTERQAYYCALKRRAEKDGGAGRESEESLLNVYRTLASPSELACRREEIERIEEVFDRIPADYREVILLFHLVGFTHAEIAARLGRTEGAVRVLLFRALARVAELLCAGKGTPEPGGATR
jgi:RNA polymerase sigma-70 factor (ECF subfamily)